MADLEDLLDLVAFDLDLAAIVLVPHFPVRVTSLPGSAAFGHPFAI